MPLDRALAFWNSRLGHPAWQALAQSPPALREAVRAAYEEEVRADAVDGMVPTRTALRFSLGREPG